MTIHFAICYIYRIYVCRQDILTKKDSIPQIFKDKTDQHHNSGYQKVCKERSFNTEIKFKSKIQVA